MVLFKNSKNWKKHFFSFHFMFIEISFKKIKLLRLKKWTVTFTVQTTKYILYLFLYHSYLLLHNVDHFRYFGKSDMQSIFKSISFISHPSFISISSHYSCSNKSLSVYYCNRLNFMEEIQKRDYFSWFIWIINWCLKSMMTVMVAANISLN